MDCERMDKTEHFYTSVCINRNTAIRVSHISQFKFIRHLVLNFYGLTVVDISHSIHILVLEHLKLRLHQVSFIYYIFATVATTFIIIYSLHLKFSEHHYVY
jgi:hypothetical protein